MYFFSYKISEADCAECYVTEIGSLYECPAFETVKHNSSTEYVQSNSFNELNKFLFKCLFR